MFGAAQTAKQSLEYTESLFFTGFTKPINPNSGDLFFDTRTNNYLVYLNGNWIEMSDCSRTEQPKIILSPILKDGKCTCCGAPDTGKMKCKYCQTTLRWYS